MSFSPFGWGSQPAGMQIPQQPTQQGIDRRKQIAEALMKVGQQGTGLSGPWGAIASTLAGGLSGWQQRKAGDQQMALDMAKQRKIAEALAAQGGDPATQSLISALPPEQQGALLGQIAANKLAAKPSARAPVTVVGADGKPRYEDPDKAIGQQPYFDPGQAPGKVREFQFAQQNGYKGSYGDFLKIDQAGIGNFNPGDYTPESFASFQKTRNPLDLKRYVAPANPVVKDVNNVPTVITPDRGGAAPTLQPLSTLPQVTSAAGAVAQAQAQGKEQGKATGAQKAKLPAQQSLQYVVGEFRKQIPQTMQGGIGGAVGKSGAVFDYKDAARFDSLRSELSSELRTIFRIPGEGDLSNLELQQYSLQLPDRNNPPEVNTAILGDIESRTGLRLGTQDAPINQIDFAPAQPADYSKLSDDDIKRQLGF